MQAESFGKYLLVERIAQGGMAEVFRAVYRGAAGVEKTVALKRILPLFHGLTDFITMFIDEARIVSSLTHVNIAQVFEFGEVDGTYYLVMELVDGVDLGRLIEAARKRNLRIDPELTAFLVAEAARGLAYAHDKRGPTGAPLGIVHRDISPHNILVSYAGEVKIADFGIAKAVGKLHRTESGAVLGKLRYMSPEQVMGEPLDGRSDLFSLGVVLYELLTGRVLFDGDNPGRVADQVKTAHITSPSEHAPGLSPELSRICLRALASGREGRYARAADLARDLAVYLSSAAPGLGREDLGGLVLELVPHVEREAAPDPLGLTARATPELPEVHAAVAVGHERGTPPNGAPTRPEPKRPRAALPGPSPTGPRRRAPLFFLGGALVLAVSGSAIVLQVRAGSRPAESFVIDAGHAPDDAATPDAAHDGALGYSISEGERARLLATLEALPQAEATWRGVVSEDYLAILSAVDGVLCFDSPEPQFSAEAIARLERRRVTDEAKALWRYLNAARALPPRVGLSLEIFLRSHPAYSPGEGGWGIAALATLVAPREPRHILDLMRQHTALRRWREPSPFTSGPPSGMTLLCDRQSLVARLSVLDARRGAILSRYMVAQPSETPIEHDGVRYEVISAGRDEAAANLSVRLRLTNLRSEARVVALGALRLADFDLPPAVDPPEVHLARGAVEATLLFPRFTDVAAEAAVLRLGNDRYLQVYSELLR